jgi:acetaldehyde dehydrogenase
VHTVSRVTPVPYAEIVASIASRSAGAGTRANIDEFTHTTGQAVAEVGGAERGKAIIILNPVEPPMIHLLRSSSMLVAADESESTILVDVALQALPRGRLSLSCPGAAVSR